MGDGNDTIREIQSDQQGYRVMDSDIHLVEPWTFGSGIWNRNLLKMVRRQRFLSVDPDEELVVDTIKALGNDNIVISTDWRHGDSSFPQALNTFLKIDGISDESRRKILRDNCARLYNIRD